MAGFFGFFDYTKPGKGVRKDEPERSRFVQFFILSWRKLGKLIQLNFIFTLFCIPIITIGPAIAGMTYVLRNFADERPVFLFSDFWDAFKSNFKQSLAYELIFAATAYMLWIAWQYYFNGAAENAFFYIPAALVFFMVVIFLFANFYIFLMIVTIQLPLKAILKNGLILAVLGIKNNLLTTFFVGLIVFLLWGFNFAGLTYLIYPLIGFAFIGFIIVYNAYPDVKKYIITPCTEQDSGGNDDKAKKENIFLDESKKGDNTKH